MSKFCVLDFQYCGLNAISIRPSSLEDFGFEPSFQDGGSLFQKNPSRLNLER